MAFAANVILLLLYFVRPQDWVPGIAGFNIIKPVVALGVIGIFAGDRSRRWKWFSSPGEMALLALLGYVAFATPEGQSSFTDLAALIVTGLLVTHAVVSEELLERYLKWWMYSLMAVLGIALLTQAGVDVTGAGTVLSNAYGRFCLNTWLMDNPNAFAHSMVQLMPLAYYMWCFRRSMVSRVAGVVVIVMTFVGIVPTESKGGFLAGTSGLIISLLFGRKFIVQIIVVMLAFGMLGTLLAALPRMQGMNNLRADEGVLGRLLVWEQALTVAKEKAYGEGYKKFQAIIPWKQGQIVELVPKATHSSFVKVGADLGYVGMAFYAGLLVVGMRTVLQYRGLSDTMERSRRALFSLLVTFCISGWMIDRAYHNELFFFLGGIAAYHHLSVRSRNYALPVGDKLKVNSGQELESVMESGRKAPKLWRRLGLLDIGLACLASWLVFWFWEYLLRAV